MMNRSNLQLLILHFSNLTRCSVNGSTCSVQDNLNPCLFWRINQFNFKKYREMWNFVGFYVFIYKGSATKWAMIPNGTKFLFWSERYNLSLTKCSQRNHYKNNFHIHNIEYLVHNEGAHSYIYQKAMHLA